jgi:hypothetical protein
MSDIAETQPKREPLISGFDVLAAVGLMLVAGGLWMIYPPLAPIVVGVVAFVIGVKAQTQ